MKPKNFPGRVKQRRIEAAARLRKHVSYLSVERPDDDTSNQEEIISNTLTAVEQSGTRATRTKKNREKI